MIADQMEEWLLGDACDGFNIMFPFVPAGLDDFVERVVPELQRRGIFRREYEGTTLRENLGLPRPENRFFPGAAKALGQDHTGVAELDFIEKYAASPSRRDVKDCFLPEDFVGPFKSEPEASEVSERTPASPHLGPVEQFEAV